MRIHLTGKNCIFWPLCTGEVMRRMQSGCLKTGERRSYGCNVTKGSMCMRQLATCDVLRVISGGINAKSSKCKRELRLRQTWAARERGRDGRCRVGGPSWCRECGARQLNRGRAEKHLVLRLRWSNYTELISLQELGWTCVLERTLSISSSFPLGARCVLEFLLLMT